MSDAAPAGTFTNPVFNCSFPDPYVLKFRGQYFAFATGLADDGLCFPRLRSRDLVHWEELSGAMQPLRTGEPYYWAPEVTYLNGKFYLYYSVGNETFMTIRVAVSDTPAGEFLDVGKKLTTQDFAIDPHVFRDTDGRIFLFYATDFLDYSHIGTGTVVDEMIDPFTLRGEPRPVTRAQFDWQVYDPARKEKGGVRWHTVEGPFVLKRKNVYYQMFSGGNWKNISYGVSFAVTDNIESENEWSQYSDGLKTAPILQTIPDRVIGPGHNSVVEGPNNRELYCIYHRWEGDNRVLAIDRMGFAGDGHLFVTGPSFEPQIAPYKPQIFDDFYALDLERWNIRKGEWHVDNNELLSKGGKAEITTGSDNASFLCRVYVRVSDQSDACAGVSLFSPNGHSASFALRLKAGRQYAELKIGDRVEEFVMPPEMDFTVFHELSAEVDGRELRIAFDGQQIDVKQQLESSTAEIGLFSEKQPAAFSAFSLTYGLKDLFESGDLDIRGWTVNEEKRFVFKNNLLSVTGDEKGDARLERRLPCEKDFELAINLRFVNQRKAHASLTLSCGNTFVIAPSPRWQIEAGDACFAMPENLSGNDWHQFRFVAVENDISIWLDNFFVGTVQKDYWQGLSVLVRDAGVCFDMIRFTQI